MIWKDILQNLIIKEIKGLIMERTFYKRKHPIAKTVSKYFNTIFREESLEMIEFAREIEEFFEQEADRYLSQVEADFY